MSPSPPSYDSLTFQMSPVVELKANGQVSRIRSHKGNAPTLPQTKYCPLCPAKFTRTTHLHRHIRSHTNERAHRCDLCGAEFTRSDLLTRHKKTCGDPLSAHRSRRKSCQACAESKVKCNLQYPCSKCSSRGKQCVFINDPAVSRHKKYGARKRTSQVKTESQPIVISDQKFLCSSSSPASSPESLPASPTFHHTLLPGLDFNCTPDFSPLSSSHSSPPSDILDTVMDDDAAADVIINRDGELTGLEPHMDKIFSNGMFDSLLDHFSFSNQDTSHASAADFSWLGGSDATGYDTDYSLPSSHSAVSMPTPPEYGSPLELPRTNSPPYTASSGGYSNPSSMSNGVNPADTEQQQYLYLFFSAFCAQLPLVHPSTWMTEDKPPILLRAMQACGALFVKTRRAANFITETLSSTRDVLIQEFTKVSSGPKEQDFLILAAVLLQTIGLFHQRADLRVSSNVYHGMLVMMIRRTGSIARSRSWAAPDMNDPPLLEHAWREWAFHETVKRALLLSYLHDCCHSVFFSMRPSFPTAEFDINLPCDDAVWKARTSMEWFELIQKPSPFGVGAVRLYGVSMQQALTNLGEMRLSISHAPLNSFSQFILIHTILRNIYISYSRNTSDSTILLLSTSASPSEPVTDEGRRGNHFATQYALHNWLQSWIQFTDTPRLDDDPDEPPFIYNSLPFYWLAQVSLLAIQEGGSAWVEETTENRFHVMKEWLDRIRFFLRQNHEIPPHLWEELMAIRRQISQADPSTLGDHPNGLLSFFSEH
ncbi:uncharacterized protein BT62DRAFT_171823 [Guyanagaster necrorhizus]|uniref:Uncharacterized protein n=1 Tax=Guyanagaster necrorhizus TaxID=856835 RepID=A0A9P7VRN0_9AGAR|nr:uncharacterized protein BT62DRAFT_171823 [Guyanagaster necrorhizus MCA 3950]KAG7445659.1 hypothetical protein BT62DRAFT_171823 [Guyanagaster necrorhizus MCA 3950]